MKIQSYTLSHNNHKQVPSRQVPLHKREDDERVWLSWNNWMTRKLFHITNSSVIFGCLVGLVCYHQCHRHTWLLGLSCLLSPMPPSYLVAWFILFVINQVHRHTWLLGLSCLLSPMPPSYLVAWFILFVINQFHFHIWLFGLSCLLSTNFTIIFGCSQYFQQGWTHQCRYI